MILRHLHLPGTVPYARASTVQDKLVKKLLAHKLHPDILRAPDPAIITAQFHPVYSCGRRDVGRVGAEQKQYLGEATRHGRAAVVESLRGGRTTFHGPGQLVAYPVLDLRRHALTPRSYVALLESCVIATCAHYGVHAIRTDNPGVWTDDEHKICALGVHVRRNVTSHGIGFNVDTELGWFDRIVGCGLEGKRTTSLRERGVGKEVGVEEVAEVLVRKFWERLKGVEASVRIGEEGVR